MVVNMENGNGNIIANINISDKDEKDSFGEIDYAILKSVANNTTTVNEIINILQIRTLIIEKHIYFLVKGGFMDLQRDHFIITSNGYEAINSFESKSGNWRSIEEFIISEIKKRKEQKLKTYKIIDMILLASIIILIILVIYFGIFY